MIWKSHDHRGSIRVKDRHYSDPESPLCELQTVPWENSELASQLPKTHVYLHNQSADLVPLSIAYILPYTLQLSSKMHSMTGVVMQIVIPSTQPVVEMWGKNIDLLRNTKRVFKVLAAFLKVPNSILSALFWHTDNKDQECRRHFRPLIRIITTLHHSAVFMALHGLLRGIVRNP